MRMVAVIFGIAGGVLGLVGLVLAVHVARVLVNLAMVIFDVTDAQGPLMRPWDGAAMSAYTYAWPVLLFAALALVGAIAVARSPLFAAGLFALSAVGMGVTLQWFSVGTVAALLLAAIWAVRFDREPLFRASPVPGRAVQVFTPTPSVGPLSPVAVPVASYSGVRRVSDSAA